MAFPTGWNRKCELVIQASQVSSALTDFPLLLTADTLPSEMFDADGSNPAQNGGGDIRFSSDSAGASPLPCEVVSFVTDNDPANGAAEIWVKVPNVYASSDTPIYVWYNTSNAVSQPDATDPYGRDSVWGDYDVVMHMAGNAADSTGNHTPTVSGATALTKGYDFDGTNDYIDVCSLSANQTDQTVLFIDAEPDNNIDYNSSQEAFFSAYDDTTDGRVFEYAAGNTSQPGGQKWIFGVSDGSSYSGVFVINLEITANQRIRNVLSRNGSTLSFYSNNTTPSTSTTPTIPSTNTAATNLFLGARTGASTFFDGTIYSFRMRKLADVNSDWVDAEYTNQDNPGAFVVEGTPESTVPTLTLPTVTSVTQTSATVGCSVTFN